MGSYERVHLDAATWFESLARLSAWSGTGAPLANSLRLARHLAVLAPPPYTAFVGGKSAEDEFEALIERTAFEDAAISLIGANLSWEVLAQSLDGRVAARVWTDGERDENRAVADAPALALLQAWTGFLLSLAPREGVQATGISHKSA